jgi:membrane dipeptidase
MALSAEALHRNAIVIDATCPLVTYRQHFDLYRKGGCTAIAPTVGGSGGSPGAGGTLAELGRWHTLLRERDDLLLVRRAGDVEQAKREGRLGLVLHFQGTDPIENDLDLVEAYKALGVGIIQLTYNVKNRVGDGCEERTDAGLSRFGLRLIERMNKARVIVDCSHTGYRTTLDAIHASSAPVVFSHANAYAVHPSPRNIKDDQAKAVAATGGLVGIVGYPAFVAATPRPTLDQMLDHAAYYADLIGTDHIGIGVDFFTGQRGIVDDATARRMYDQLRAAGRWSDGYPPPPYYYPQGLETPDKFANLTAALLKRGFSESDTRKILGENWVRIYRAVWG